MRKILVQYVANDKDRELVYELIQRSGFQPDPQKLLDELVEIEGVTTNRGDGEFEWEISLSRNMTLHERFDTLTLIEESFWSCGSRLHRLAAA